MAVFHLSDHSHRTFFQFAARGRDFDRHELLYRTEYQSAGGAWVLFLHESTEDPGTSGIPGRIYSGELLLVPHGLFLQLCDLRVLSGIGGLSVSGPCPGEKGVAVCRRSSAGL